MTNHVYIEHIQHGPVSSSGVAAPITFGIKVFDSHDLFLYDGWESFMSLTEEINPKTILYYVWTNYPLNQAFWSEIMRSGGLFLGSDQESNTVHWYNLVSLGYVEGIEEQWGDPE